MDQHVNVQSRSVWEVTKLYCLTAGQKTRILDVRCRSGLCKSQDCLDKITHCLPFKTDTINICIATMY